ncbi:tripartite ATP-independent transporter DctM subunit [Marinomonas alcarazii]|uniref:Tripartite ATP-independent transporter DctM subunit n=1 Tax=Marinomonas alcarazii TaxID=491949 RepID=A0A318VJN2_9GAMM|nr:TRAP transporter large permease subunit [Marinomonas alcarazii]PYF83989.1 tripartite ATP-independent transporter DctM subunit [Marinomonas alcarazii]
MNYNQNKNGISQILLKVESFLEVLLKVFLMALLSGMVFLIVYQVFCRYFLNSPSSVSEELLRYSNIWLGILGASLCFLKEKHLNLPIFIDHIGEGKAIFLESFITVINVFIGGVILYGGILGLNNAANTPILKINFGILQSVMIVSGSIITASQFIKIIRKGLINKKAFLYFFFCSVFLLIFAYLFGLFKGSDSFESLIFENLESSSFIILFFSFFFMLFIGVPIAVGLAISGILTLSLQMDFSDLLSMSGQTIFRSLDNFGFLALPFFILAGNIMNQGGIARKLIDFAMLLGRKIPGSLWQTNIVANMLFGSLSGSAIASATAIGGIISPMAKEKNYNMPFTTAVNASSSICGMLIPPTGVFIVYSLITGGEASIASLFLAGYVPGIILGLSVMIVAYRYAKKNGYEVSAERINLSESLAICWGAIPSLTLIIIVIGGIIGGVFTAIEASGIAVLYSLILSLFYRSLSLKKIFSILHDSVLSSSVILFLIACSSLMSWSMTFAYIPDVVADFLSGISENKYVILLFINITLLLVGVFMDMSPALLIFTPILYPIVTSLGVDPIHFGVIMVYNLSIGVVTPPVGTVLFVSCSISGEKITKVIKPLLPIFFFQFIGLLIVTYFPEISLFLPKFFGLM